MMRGIKSNSGHAGCVGRYNWWADEGCRVIPGRAYLYHEQEEGADSSQGVFTFFKRDIVH